MVGIGDLRVPGDHENLSDIGQSLHTSATLCSASACEPNARERKIS